MHVLSCRVISSRTCNLVTYSCNLGTYCRVVLCNLVLQLRVVLCNLVLQLPEYCVHDNRKSKWGEKEKRHRGVK